MRVCLLLCAMRGVSLISCKPVPRACNPWAIALRDMIFKYRLLGCLLIPNRARGLSCRRNKSFSQTALASGLRRLRHEYVCEPNKLDGMVFTTVYG